MSVEVTGGLAANEAAVTEELTGASEGTEEK